MNIIKHLLGSIALTLGLAALSSAMAAHAEQTAVFAGGCFWGVDAVFKHVKGVAEVTSGYAGGSAATAHYEQVSNGNSSLDIQPQLLRKSGRKNIHANV